MKPFYFIAALSLLIFACKSASNAPTQVNPIAKELTQLHDAQNYFELRRQFEANNSHLKKVYRSYFEALIKNVFNQGQSSNVIIADLLSNHTNALTKNQISELLQAKLNNDINLYQYKEAAETSEILLHQYRENLDSNLIVALTNEIKIWTALSEIPRQTITKTDDSSIPLTRDKVGLFNIDVEFPKKTINFIYDTGANLSTVARSMVEPLGLRMLDSDFYVTAATGKKVKTDLAIADTFTLGNMVFKNVVFLVIEDADVSFPQIDYYIHGIIGFPVIEAMDEIQITEGSLFIPQDALDYTYQNFALDGLMPIVEVINGKDRLMFSFDSGASNTSLYPAYYHKYQSTIDDKHVTKEISSASAGGAVTFTGFDDISTTLTIANTSALLENLQLHKNAIGGEASNFHGNLGQDFIKQFDKMVISFKSGAIFFE